MLKFHVDIFNYDKNSWVFHGRWRTSNKQHLVLGCQVCQSNILLLGDITYGLTSRFTMPKSSILLWNKSLDFFSFEISNSGLSHYMFCLTTLEP
jgi:hypothetical protein